jgi:hypothetical protein
MNKETYHSRGCKFSTSIRGKEKSKLRTVRKKMIAQGSVTIGIDLERMQILSLLDFQKIQIIELTNELKKLNHDHGKSVEKFLEFAELLEELRGEYSPPTSERERLLRND